MQNKVFHCEKLDNSQNALQSCTFQVPLFKLCDGEHHGICQLCGQNRMTRAELKQNTQRSVRKLASIHHITQQHSHRKWCHSDLIDDFGKLQQSGAHDLIITPERKTLPERYILHEIMKPRRDKLKHGKTSDRKSTGQKSPASHNPLAISRSGEWLRSVRSAKKCTEEWKTENKNNIC